MTTAAGTYAERPRWRPLHSFVDDRHRLSLSRLQMLLWTVLVLSACLAAALANIGRDSAAPMNVDIRPSSGSRTAESRFADLFHGEEAAGRDDLDLGNVQTKTALVTAPDNRPTR